MATSGGALVFKAGADAYDAIKTHGFGAEMVGTLVGASGGAKWLVLSQLDRVLLRQLVPQFREPVFLLGSSIGAWRFACYGQADAVAAIERLEAAYVEQTYSEQPTVAEISAKMRSILTAVLGADGAAQILAHPVFRINIMTVRSRHVTASDRRPLLAGGLLLAMLGNLISRRTLGAFFSRGLFYDPRERAPFHDVGGFPLDRTPLTVGNLDDAVVASGAIPLVLSGVRDIAGAPKGTYRDGGIIDYHLDFVAAANDRIALFPHFFDWLKPGWFDRQLRWRRVNPQHFARTLMLCPSPEFIRNLPGGKVPDRSDFVRLDTATRIDRWRKVVERCRELADELNDVLARGALPARLERL